MSRLGRQHEHPWWISGRTDRQAEVRDVEEDGTEKRKRSQVRGGHEVILHC